MSLYAYNNLWHISDALKMFNVEQTNAYFSFSDQCTVFIVSEFTVFENPDLEVFELNHFPSWIQKVRQESQFYDKCPVKKKRS